ncbi:glycosyltransferase family 2 protein [Candidatus Saccharibacteria bacterium]|nr:glycosyltransferase family 2 protein [Candidatus Saccharibacteria bacterium]
MTKKNPLVSIIIPCYNSAKTLNSTLKTVLAQSYTNLEIIVVSDGSTDETVKIAKSIKDPRIQVIEKKNGGVSTARNAGLDVAKGQFVMFVDSDDRIAETMVEKMLNRIVSHPKSLIVCGKQIGKRKISVHKDTTVTKKLPKHIVTSILKSGHLYSPCNKIFNLQLIKDNNIRFVKKVEFGEDLIFNLEYLKYIDSITYLKECLYYYDMTEEGSSHRTKSDYKYRVLMLEQLRSYLGDEIKKPDIAIKYNLIRLRWQISTKRAKLKQGKKK